MTAAPRDVRGCLPSGAGGVWGALSYPTGVCGCLPKEIKPIRIVIVVRKKSAVYSCLDL